MDHFTFKKSTNTVKFSGLDDSLDLEDDIFRPDYEEAFRRHQEAEEMKRRLMNKHLDPTYMESNIPEPPVVSGGLSLDPNDMTFNFK